jgi:hypothetical protein
LLLGLLAWTGKRVYRWTQPIRDKWAARRGERLSRKYAARARLIYDLDMKASDEFQREIEAKRRSTT